MRSEILNRIENLLVDNCHKCPYFRSESNKQSYCINYCEIGNELKSMGDKLTELSSIKQQEILNKGADMTIKEILYLRNRGLSRDVIKRSAKIHSKNQRSFFEAIEGRATRGGKMLDGVNA